MLRSIPRPERSRPGARFPPPPLLPTARPPMTLPILAAPLVLAFGSATPTPVQDEREYRTREEAAGAAIEAIRQGQLERAREILGAELVADHLERAAALLDAGEPASALPHVDAALDIEERLRPALVLRGEGLLALGEQNVAAGQGGYAGGFFADAERAFERAGTSPQAMFGRARAAYLQNRAEDARRFALGGAELLRTDLAVEAAAPAESPGDMPADVAADIDGQPEAGQPTPTDPPPALLDTYRFGSAQRILADACYLAYAEQAQALYDRTPESDAELEQARYEEALAEVDALIGVAPQDPATWTLLADLHLFRSAARGHAGEAEAALSALELGLERVPDDPVLLERLVSSARSQGGSPLVVETLERYTERLPGSVAGRLALGAERYELALQAIPSDLAQTDGFRSARTLFEAVEQDFAHLREGLTAEDEDAGRVLAWQVVSRTAQGWMDYWSGDLERAEATFLSTEEIAPQGARYDYGERMRSGVRGLQGLVGKAAERQDLEAATRLSDHLVGLLPEDATMWNDAGLFRRDHAVQIEYIARQLCRAAAGEVEDTERIDELRDAAEVAPELYDTEAEKRIFRDQADRFRERALAEMQRSAEAYERALELAPDDVPETVILLNDSALIYVHYLHEGLEQAETRLLRAIEVGEAQLANPDLDEAQREIVTLPYGDAHENLGVHYLLHQENPERARMYFEKSVEIGPGPRPIVTDYYLPRCAGEEPQGFGEFEPDALRWGAPCE